MPLTTFMTVLLKRHCVTATGVARMCTAPLTARKLDERVTVAERHWEMNKLEEGRRRVQVRKYKDAPTSVDIRLWYTKQIDGKTDRPSRKGVELTVEEFKKLVETSKEILAFAESP